MDFKLETYEKNMYLILRIFDFRHSYSGLMV